MAKDTQFFYTQLPVFDDFSAVSDLSNYTEIPSDWFVVTADVQNSTGAIKSGLYKAVNIIGVSVITSVRNAAKPLEIPYIFGGDGASLCIPPNLLNKARQALISTKKMAITQFGLQLRVGVIPVNVLLKAGHRVLIARHRMSRFLVQTAFAGNGIEHAKDLVVDEITQAAFTGGGIEYAEHLLKDDNAGKPFRFDKEEVVAEADYTGLECRWDHVYSIHGETISLIVKALSSNIEEQARFYTEIIETIKTIYGDDEVCRPVQTGSLHLSSDNNNLSHELKVKTFMHGKRDVIIYWLYIRIHIILGWVFMRLKLKIGDVFWGEYKNDLVSNIDFKKFDGVLREVISGTAEQRMELTAYLEKRYKNGECVYGIHTSDSALVTCMINNRSGEHFHFVDGSDGGYAMAATAMKDQMRQKQ